MPIVSGVVSWLVRVSFVRDVRMLSLALPGPSDLAAIYPVLLPRRLVYLDFLEPSEAQVVTRKPAVDV